MRGDAFPVANTSWTQVSVTVLNHGLLARTMAHTWILGVAWCGDKDFALLGRLFKPLFQVLPIVNLYLIYCALTKLLLPSELRFTCIHLLYLCPSCSTREHGEIQ